MSNESSPDRAGQSPEDMVSRSERLRAEAVAQGRVERCRQAVALANVLGVDDAHRSSDQRLVWEYLTGLAFKVAMSHETNQLMIFEGMRRRASEIIVLVDESKAAPKG